MYYYIGTNRVDMSGYTHVMIKAESGWAVPGYTGHYWHQRVKASEVTEREDLLKFTTYHDAYYWLMAEGRAFDDEIIEVKEEVEEMKLYAIAMELFLGDYTLVSVIDDKTPLVTIHGEVAVVSANPAKLEHLRDMLPEESFAKIVEVTMGDNGKWVIGEYWKPEPGEQRYIYKLKGMTSETYLMIDDGEVGLTGMSKYASKFTRDEVMGLASKQGLKLTAFEEIEVEND